MSFESHVYEVFSTIIKRDGEDFFKTVSEWYGRDINTILKNDDISQKNIQEKLIGMQNMRMKYIAMYNKEKRKKFITAYVEWYRKDLASAKSIYEIYMLKTTLEQQKICTELEQQKTYTEDDSLSLPKREKTQLLKEVHIKLFSVYKKIIAKTEAMYEVKLLKEKLEQRKIEAEDNDLSFFTEEEQNILFYEMDAKLEELDRKKTSASMRRKFLAQENPTFLPAIVKPQENETFIKKEKEVLAS